MKGPGVTGRGSRLLRYGVFAPRFADGIDGIDGIEEIGTVSFSDTLYPAYFSLDIGSGTGDYIRARFTDPSGEAGTLDWTFTDWTFTTAEGETIAGSAAVAGPKETGATSTPVTPSVFFGTLLSGYHREDLVAVEVANPPLRTT